MSLSIKTLLFVLMYCVTTLGQTVVLPKTTVISKTVLLGSSSLPNPILVTDVTNGSFCQSGPTCNADSVTTTTGDVLLVFIFINTTTIGNIDTPSGCGNTYTALASNSTLRKSRLFFAIATSSGSCTVTGNFSGALTSINEQVYVQLWRGAHQTTPVVSSSIGSANAPGTGSNALSSSIGGGSTISGTQTNNSIAGGTMGCDGFIETISAGTGYTLSGIHTNVGNCAIAGESKSLTSAASNISTTFTTTPGSDVFHTFAAVIQHP